MSPFLELRFSVQEPAPGKFRLPRQRENEMCFVLAVAQVIEPAAIALIAEGKFRICPGYGMLHAKAHAIAAPIQITLQFHANLSREVGVVLP